MSGRTPYSDTRPIVGLIPVSPWAFEGFVIDPPVCVPVLEAAMRAATAVADPLDEPLGLTSSWCGAHALAVVRSPVGVLAAVVASGPICVLPSRIAPASRSRAQAVASKSGTKPSKMNEFAVVRTPAVKKLSLIASGTPVRGPLPRLRSAVRAASRAASETTVLNAW